MSIVNSGSNEKDRHLPTLVDWKFIGDMLCAEVMDHPYIRNGQGFSEDANDITITSPLGIPYRSVTQPPILLRAGVELQMGDMSYRLGQGNPDSLSAQ